MEDDTSMQTPGDAADEEEDTYSYIYPIGYSNSSDCGYCRGGQSKKRYSYYASTVSLDPSFYQKLVDRCWRRSGTLLYRPNQKHSCCPHYTLRLDSTEFKPTRDQRKALNRFNHYVLGEAYAKEAARLYPRSREEARKRDNEFDLVERVHEVERHNVKSPPDPAHEFTVAMEPDTFTEEKYALFENYQRLVHHEGPNKISRNGFKRFLCNSPLTREMYTAPDGKERKLGSYHHCYRLDGRLVAMGVLDLLPDCVSSVYFLYDESMHHHSPGKLGALREIALAVEEGYRWWYSGYYIHSCPKMRYKIDYSPQYVLDPESLEWHRLDKEALKIFDRKRYVSLSRERQRLASSEGPGAEPRSASPVADQEMTDGTDESAEKIEIEQEKEKAPNGDAMDEDEDEVEDDDDDSAFLFQSNMPGIPSLEQMQQVDMDDLAFRTEYFDGHFVLSDLVHWASEDMSVHGSLKARIAELVATVGPDLMDGLCLDFRPRERS